MAKKVDKKIEKAIRIIDRMSMDEREWEIYQSRQKAIFNYNVSMANSKKEGFEERN